jgi:two-component system, NtrC family, sensor kinase
MTNSLKTKILLYVGIIIIALMMLISISVLFQWRSMILSSQRQNALAIAQTFSISILDALIYQESGMIQSEGFLENHIHNFLNKNDQIKFVNIYDQYDQIMVRSSYQGREPGRSESSNLPPSHHPGPQLRIYRSEMLGWILEVTLPLQIHSKSWGTLKVGFDITPTRRKLQQMFFMLCSLTVVSVLIILTVIYFLIDRLTQSLRGLVTEINRFDLENIEPIAMKVGNDEIGFLVGTFEKMKRRLAQSRNQLLDAQRQIYHAEKLASIGRLASGVAHEINNPLQGLKSCLFAIEKEPHNHAQTVKYLGLANEGLDHIAMIVQKLVGFSRTHAKQVMPIDLNENIEKVLSLLAYRLDKNNIQVMLQLDRQAPLIHADPFLLQEVIMNLLLNSFDAIDADGAIVISTTAAGENLLLTIADSGCGISQDDMDKIFDPFFTTKDEGKGTGLGLSVALGIVEAHGGSISVKSTPGHGATISVRLPLKGTV